MDSLTQAVLGASIQGVGMSRYQGRKAYLYGAALATLPDLDVLIHYENPIQAMISHRSFSHSIFILTLLAALIVWLVFYQKKRHEYSQKRLFLFTWLSLITHPILDSFTVYGTQLFYPFPFHPESWSSIFIIDPLYTLPLLIATICGLIIGHRRLTVIISGVALAVSTSYLMLSLYTKHLAENAAREILQSEKIEISRIKSMPMPLTIFLWQVFVEDSSNHKRYEVITGTFDHHGGEWREMPYSWQNNHLFKYDFNYMDLAWFTNNWVDVVLENGQWIVEDERMNSDGKAYFRFVIAEDNQGEIKPIPPKIFPKVVKGNYQERLSQLWQRLKDEKPLPYADWHVGNTKK